MNVARRTCRPAQLDLAGCLDTRWRTDGQRSRRCFGCESSSSSESRNSGRGDDRRRNSHKRAIRRQSTVGHSAFRHGPQCRADDRRFGQPDARHRDAGGKQLSVDHSDPGLLAHLVDQRIIRALTVRTGAGDQYDVEQTPPGITQLVFNNALVGTQNAVYASGASSPIVANGNFSIYLGWRLNLDGSMTQLDQLSGLAVSVTLNFSGDPTATSCWTAISTLPAPVI